MVHVRVPVFHVRGCLVSHPFTSTPVHRGSDRGLASRSSISVWHPVTSTLEHLHVPTHAHTHLEYATGCDSRSQIVTV